MEANLNFLLIGQRKLETCIKFSNTQPLAVIFLLGEAGFTEVPKMGSFLVTGNYLKGKRLKKATVLLMLKA